MENKGLISFKSSKLIAIFSLIFAMFIWGSSLVAIKITLNDIGPFSTMFFRMLIASCCFIYFIKSFFKYDFTKKDIKIICILVVLEPCLYFIFEAKALQFTTASQAGMITSLLPLIAGVGAGYFLKERITLQLVIGSLIAMAGAIFLSSQATTSLEAPHPILGNLFEFFAMVCGAGYTITARYLTYKFSALFITALQVFVGAIFFFPLFIYESFTMDLNFTFEAVSCLFYLGIVVTLGGYGLYNFALTKIEASKAAIFVYLIPLFTLLLANLILSEKISTLEFIACMIILFGVFVSEFSFKKFKNKG